MNKLIQAERELEKARCRKCGRSFTQKEINRLAYYVAGTGLKIDDCRCYHCKNNINNLGSNGSQPIREQG